MNKNVNVDFSNYKANPWIGLFIVVIVVNLTLWFSTGKDWNHKRAQIKEYQKDSINLQKENRELNDEITEYNLEIRQKGKEVKVKTDMEFPTEIVKSEISEALETYSLLTQEDVVLEYSTVRNIYIKEIKFEEKPVLEELTEDAKAMSSRVTISLEGEENTFKGFIKYLRTHEIPCEMKILLKDGTNNTDLMKGCPSDITPAKIINSNSPAAQRSSYQYAKEKVSQIERYKLPVMLIDSIKMNKKENKSLSYLKDHPPEVNGEELLLGDYFDVIIEGRIFSRTEEQIEADKELEEELSEGEEESEE